MHLLEQSAIDTHRMGLLQPQFSQMLSCCFATSYYLLRGSLPVFPSLVVSNAGCPSLRATSL